MITPSSPGMCIGRWLTIVLRYLSFFGTSRIKCVTITVLWSRPKYPSCVSVSRLINLLFCLILCRSLVICHTVVVRWDERISSFLWSSVTPYKRFVPFSDSRVSPPLPPRKEHFGYVLDKPIHTTFSSAVFCLFLSHTHTPRSGRPLPPPPHSSLSPTHCRSFCPSCFIRGGEVMPALRVVCPLPLARAGVRTVIGGKVMAA